MSRISFGSSVHSFMICLGELAANTVTVDISEAKPLNSASEPKFVPSSSSATQ